MSCCYPCLCISLCHGQTCSAQCPPKSAMLVGLQGALPVAWGNGSKVSWQDGAMQMGPQPFMFRLHHFACESCGLLGPLPDWDNMDSLRVLSLARNNLTGLSHFGARRLVSLVLDWNPLSAKLEPMLGWGWPLLQHLGMAHCQLYGTLPPGGLANGLQRLCQSSVPVLVTCCTGQATTHMIQSGCCL
jgi:hypothetical protein